MQQDVENPRKFRLSALLPQSRQARLVWLLVGLGIAARAVRFLLRFPLWPDEAYLATNFLDRGYLGLMERLDQDQVCPLLFLWTELSAVKLLGFTEYTLRLFPFLCGVGSLLIFRHVAGRLLSGAAEVLAVGLFAAAYPLIRYSAETKPYATDVLVTAALIALFVEWWRTQRKGRALAALLVCTPLALGLSYPAVFVAGGISVAMAVSLLATSGGLSQFSPERKWDCPLPSTHLPSGTSEVPPGRRDLPAAVPAWLGWAAYNACLAGSFLLWFALCTRNQSGATLEAMHGCWEHTFPPLDSLWGLAKWLIAANFREMVGYPLGELSALCGAACLAALTMLLWRRQYAWFCLAAGPLLLNLIAAALHRYPYGGPVRFMLYAAPIVCLLAGLAASHLLPGRRDACTTTQVPSRQWPVMRVAVLLLCLIAGSSMVRDFICPYKRPEFQRERDFARWFWTSKSEDAELVCLATDYRPSIRPRHAQGFSECLYYCNQRIYSPRHARGAPPQFDRVSAEHPLRCVELLTEKLGPTEEFNRWLSDMQARYALVHVETHHLVARSKDDDVLYRNRVNIYEFVPKGSPHAPCAGYVDSTASRPNCYWPEPAGGVSSAGL